MHDQPTSSLPDPRVVEQVLSALDKGVPPEVEALGRAVDAPQDEIRTILAAVRTYRDAVASEREGRSPVTLEDDALPPGTRIGDFVVDSVLGRGAMGVVYRARQTSLGDRVVALKVLPKTLIARDARFADRFRREATLAAKIHHPNLAEVYGFEATTDLLCFAMQFIEGRTLQDVLVGLAGRDRGPLRVTSTEHVRRCAMLARALADALGAIHTEGLVHRDVKPSNVILEAAGEDDAEAFAARPVLVDFGLLRPAGGSELTGTHTLLGTPAYASPESRLGRVLDQRADVFSLGATLHDLLTLTAPSHRGPATAGLPDARAINPAVDLRLAAILAMALQDRRELRYESGSALRDELDRYLGEQPIRALPTSTLGRLRLWMRRNPLPAVRTGALSLLAVAALVLLGSFGAWAVGLTQLAGDAKRMEGDGDLIGAARTLHDLAERPNVEWLPWLRDDLEHAGWYLGEDQPLSEAVKHLLAGEAALEGRGDSKAAAEREFARANDRLCELLFSEHAERFGDVIRRFLMREVRDGAPEFRQRLAMGTWANCLIVQEASPEHGRLVPEGLSELLQEKIVASAGSRSESATRQAAVAAFGAIRDPGVFEALVELVRDGDEKVARLAYSCSYTLFRWLHMTSPQVWSQTEGRLLVAWAEGVAELGRRLGQPDLLSTVAAQIAWWERNPETSGPELPVHVLELSEGVRREVDEAQRWHAEEWAASAADIVAIKDPVEGCEHWGYLVVAGRAVDRYEAGIWQDEPGPGANGPLGARAREEVDADTSFGRIEFLPQTDGSVRAVLSGTVIAAARTQTTLWPWPDRPDGRGFLRLDRPGRSQLRVVTLIPPNTIGLQILIQHMLGARQVLPGMGRVAFRLALDDLPGELISEAPDGSGPGHIHRLGVPAHHFAGRHELEVVLDYLHGNTTYRVLQVELVWDHSTPK